MTRDRAKRVLRRILNNGKERSLVDAGERLCKELDCGWTPRECTELIRQGIAASKAPETPENGLSGPLGQEQIAKDH